MLNDETMGETGTRLEHLELSQTPCSEDKDFKSSA
jgi:hypothetical protein